MISHATQAHRDELQSFAAKAGISPDLLAVANTIMDLHRGGFACSSLMVEPKKSQTGGVLFGRNLDCVNTNHFRSKSLCLGKACSRYAWLATAAAIEKLDVAEVFKKLDEVNLGQRTVQSMVFEPGPLVLHVAMGKCPATKGTLEKLDLKPFFGSSGRNRAIWVN